MIYLDNYKGKFKNMLMSHLMADTEQELDAIASRLGLKPEWKQQGSFGPHFDLSESKRSKAVLLGAKEVTAQDLVKIFGSLR